MAEEVTGAPKPDGSITPLPKVLVQQASEDKSEGAVGGDGQTTDGSEAANVNGDVARVETPVIAPQTKAESAESNGKQVNDGAYEVTDPEDRNSISMQSQEETMQPKVQADGMATKILPIDAVIGEAIPSSKDTLPEINGNSDHHSQDGEEASKHKDDRAPSDDMEKPAPERPRSKTPDETKHVQSSEPQEQETDNSEDQAQTELPQSKTPDEANVPTSQEKPVDDDKTEVGLANGETTEPVDRNDSKTPEVGGNSENPAQDGVISTPQKSQSPTPSTKSEQKQVLPKSPTPSARSEEKTTLPKSPTPSAKSEGAGKQSPPPMTPTDQEEALHRNLLELVVSESPADLGRKSAGSYSDDPDHLEDNGEHRITPVPITAEDSQGGTVEESREESVGIAVKADDGPDASNVVVKKTSSLDEGGSMTSEERVEVENAYDASVSGNEDDSPEKTGEAAPAGEMPELQEAATPVAPEDPVPVNATSAHPPVGSPGKTTPIESAQKDIASDEEILGTEPKVVKFVQEPPSGNVANSDLSPHENRNMDNGALKPHDTRLSINPVKMKDQEEKEGHEAEVLESGQGEEEQEEERREAESQRSDDMDDYRTVVELETESAPSASFAQIAQLEEEQKKRVGELNEKIRGLEDELQTLRGQKEQEAKKVTEMSLQIKRMTDDNKNNVKTIQGYEETVQKLEEQVEKLKAQQELQVRNGTTTSDANTPKKSSVCVIL